jgi:RimJ/RimL family protein N-acetyltransferase
VVTLKRFEEEDTIKLAVLLNEDRVLLLEMGFPEGSYVTPRDARRVVRGWERARSSVCFAVMEDFRFVGMISFSKVNRKKREASAGCWIGSGFRNSGISSETFDLLLREAREMGIARLSAAISSEDQYSREVWEKAGGRGQPSENGRMVYLLEIH